MNRVLSLTKQHVLWSLFLFALLVVSAGHAAEMDVIHARVTYQIPDGIYVNVGTDFGLVQGQNGSVQLEDGRVIACQVMQAARNTALLRLDGADTELLDALRDQNVDLVFDEVAPPEIAEPVAPKTATKADAEAPFVPLLAPARRAPNFPPSKNINHGRVGIYHSFQSAAEDQQDFAMTRLNTSGNSERINGSPWSFIWSGNARLRTGEAYQNHADFETVQPVIYSLILERPLTQEGGFIRLGRFLPRELPGAGYLDGAQVEIKSNDHVRYGAMAGLKPNRRNLDFSVDEPTVAGYITLEAGKRSEKYYSGTVGVVGAFFDGQADRLAILLDQRASWNSKMDLYTTAELDLGVADTTNNTAQLSRFDLVTSYRLNRTHTLRAGVNHWERPNTQAQRDLMVVVDDNLFDGGYWRYWIGAQHKLPWNLRLNEEVSFIVSDVSDNAARWNVGLRRIGLWIWPAANIKATLYNLESMGTDGFGSRLSAYFPFWNSKLVVRPSTGMRWLNVAGEPGELSVTHYSIYLDGMISKAWTLTGGMTTTRGEGADSTLIDLGLRYRW